MKKSKILVQQLQEFGLNPKYWILKKLKQKHSWLVIHKQYQDLCLLGKTKGEKWKNLEWLF